MSLAPTTVVSDLSKVHGRFKGFKDNTSNQYIYMRDYTYRHDTDNGHTLIHTESGKTLYFYGDIPLKQLCKMIRVPFSFVKKNPTYLNNDIMQFWLVESLSSESKSNGNPDHKLVRIMDIGGKPYIRAILDYDTVIIDNSDLLDLINEYFGEEMEVALLDGVDLADPTFNVRLAFRESFDPGDGAECKIGFHLRASEVAFTPLTLNSIIYRPVCSNGLIVQYGGNPYFTSNYKEVMPEDMKALFEGVLPRLREDLNSVRNRVCKAVDEQVTPEILRTLFSQLKKQKGVSTTFIEKVEVQAVGSSAKYWDVINHITNLAQELPTDQRLKYEKFAGDLLNLNLTAV